MPLAPIEVQWGGGKWPSATRRRLGPIVRNGLELAQLCLEDEIGVSSSVSKRALVWCIDNRDNMGGSTDSADELDLYIPHRFIRRPRITERLVLPLLAHSAHELAHTYRYERGFPFSLAERAASEGISMWAEVLVGQRLLDDAEIKFITAHEMTHPLQPKDNQRLVEELIGDSAYLDAFEEAHGFEPPDVEEVHEAWFDKEPRPGALPFGYVVGIAAVGGLIDAGASLGEIMDISAQDIIGMAA